MSLLRRLVIPAAIVGVALFLAVAGFRRLNFDESLALRAGRLELQGAAAQPPFVMPTTLLLGAVSFVATSPAPLWLSLRIATAGAVVAAFVALLVAAGISRTRGAIALLFLLSQAAFFAHGLEFRYDAGILVGLLLAVAAWIRATPTGFALATAALCFVALHQTKGLLLALVLLAPLLLQARAVPGALPRCLAAGSAVLALWTGVLLVLGLETRWIETITTFLEMSNVSLPAGGLGSLGPSAIRDFAWWILAIGGLVAHLARNSRERSRTRPEILAACSSLGLMTLHPHPWPYMLALPAPFLALLFSRECPDSRDRRAIGRWCALLTSGLALQIVAGGGLPGASHLAARSAPRAPQIAAVERLIALAKPGDRVLDPSGLAYPLPPCTVQWYVDTLFQARISQGLWMAELAAGVPPRCTFALDTYRLGMLPERARRELPRAYAPVGQAVVERLERTDPVDRASESTAPLDSYW